MSLICTCKLIDIYLKAYFAGRARGTCIGLGTPAVRGGSVAAKPHAQAAVRDKAHASSQLLASLI